MPRIIFFFCVCVCLCVACAHSAGCVVVLLCMWSRPAIYVLCLNTCRHTQHCHARVLAYTTAYNSDFCAFCYGCINTFSHRIHAHVFVGPCTLCACIGVSGLRFRFWVLKSKQNTDYRKALEGRGAPCCQQVCLN